MGFFIIQKLPIEGSKENTYYVNMNMRMITNNLLIGGNKKSYVMTFQ